MPLFTRCNIGLGYPQNVCEVLAQNTLQLFYYNHLKMSFLGPVSN